MISATGVFDVIRACRACGSMHLDPVIELGMTPLADRLLAREELDGPEIRVPLTVVFCPGCGLLQIIETVRPDLLFNNRYPYHSSVSPSLRAHFAAYANQMIVGLRPGASVIEVASNDGCLLQHFVAAGMRCLGIDPADGPATCAQRAGIPTLLEFFGEATAQAILDSYGPCDLLMANNVLAHVADLHGFVRGIRLLLADRGMAVIEVPHVVPLVEQLEFDTIYHQHLCYFSLAALDHLFSRHGLALCDAESVPVHGGSLRLTVRPNGHPSPRLVRLKADETGRGARETKYYVDFANRIVRLRARLLDLLTSCRARGRIVGYGAAAKACTLLNYCDINAKFLDCVADISHHKQGLFMGGNRLPIVPVGRLREEPPAFILLLAWNFAEEIMAQLDDLAREGTRFIVPVPEPAVLPTV